MNVKSCGFRATINVFFEAVDMISDIKKQVLVLEDPSKSVVDRARAFIQLSSLKDQELNVFDNSSASVYLNGVISDCSDYLGRVSTGFQYLGQDASILALAQNLNNSDARFSFTKIFPSKDAADIYIEDNFGISDGSTTRNITWGKASGGGYYVTVYDTIAVTIGTHTTSSQADASILSKYI